MSTINTGMAQYQFSNLELLNIKDLLMIVNIDNRDDNRLQEISLNYINTINSILAARNSRG